MLHFATPWVVSRTRRGTLDSLVMMLDGSMWKHSRYDEIWQDQKKLLGTKVSDYDVIIRRRDLSQLIIFTEYKQTRRVRAQVLALKVTKEELEKIKDKKNKFTERIDRGALRLEIEKSDREICMWPVAVRAAGHTKNPEVQEEA